MIIAYWLHNVAFPQIALGVQLVFTTYDCWTYIYMSMMASVIVFNVGKISCCRPRSGANNDDRLPTQSVARASTPVLRSNVAAGQANR